ncbi:MAG TPA: hypothetical protein VFZ61_17770 [Polyangiales bacterium]
MLSLFGWALCGHAHAHPLDALSAQEIKQSFALLNAHFGAHPELPQRDLLFPLLALREPPKRSQGANDERSARKAEAHVFHFPTNRTWLAELDLDARRVSALTLAPAGTQPALSGDEYEVAAQLVRTYEPWRKAVAARGLDPANVHIDVWAPGHVELDDTLRSVLSHGSQTRLARCLAFAAAPVSARAPRGSGHPYARPIDGLIALVDLNARQVVQLRDTTPEQAVSQESGEPRGRTPPLKPLIVQQPRGSDVKLEGNEVGWGLWRFRVGLHPREGLVLYDVRVQARGELRSVAARMSLSEIYVPYGFGHADWIWRSAFDVGEYNPGGLAHELEPNRDVPENARFLKATLPSSRGPSAAHPTGAVQLARPIALYERDAGLLWSRTDPLTSARDTRLARELVVTWSAWIGNYIYGFEWIFKQDGSLEVRVQLTGSTLNRSATARPEPGAPKVGKDAAGVLMAAPNHQHFFSFRLDLDVDGARNHVMESELISGADGSFRNAFDKQKTALTREGARDAAPASERRWCVMSSTTHNLLGEHPAYTLEPGGSITPFSRDDFPGLVRAQFAKHALWVSRFAEDQRFAAGAFPSQASSREGVSRYVTPAEPLTPAQGDDVVLWYTLGLSHVPRLEDYPVMSTETIAFRLVPHGFFDRNPALEVPDQAR